jgi:hypothetical protein
LPPDEIFLKNFKKGVKFSKSTPIYITSKGNGLYKPSTYSKDAVIKQFKEE